MRIRTAYEDPIRCDTVCDEETLTKQSFKKECDINQIMSKYQRTGQISHIRASEPFYGDFSSIDDYHTALEKINASKAYFEALPAKVRSQFNNDVGTFLEFAINEENLTEMQNLGIIPKEQQNEVKDERSE